MNDRPTGSFRWERLTLNTAADRISAAIAATPRLPLAKVDYRWVTGGWRIAEAARRRRVQEFDVAAAERRLDDLGKRIADLRRRLLGDPS